MREEMIRQLKSLKHATVKPREGWVKKNRAILLSQIKNTVPEEQSVSFDTKLFSAMSIFMPQSIVMGVVRPVAVLLIVALIAPSLYYGTVKASESALPGEGLYEAKRYTEKIQVTVVGLIGNKESETKLHVEFAKRRADETSKIITTKDPQKIAKVASTVADLKNEINALSNKLEESKSDKNVPANVAKDIKKNTEAINIVLQDAKNTLLVASTDPRLAEEVKQTKDLVQEVSVKAAEVLVTKHLEGDTTVSKDEVKQVLSSSLEKTVASVTESKQNVEGFKSILDTASSEVKDLTKEMTNPANVSSTKVISDKISTAVTQTESAVQQTTAASEQATVKAGEVQQLIGTDNLAGAISAIKELTQVSQQVEKISDNTIETTKSFLPIVQVIRDSVNNPSTSTLNIGSTALNGASTTLTSTLSTTSSGANPVTSSLKVTSTTSSTR